MDWTNPWIIGPLCVGAGVLIGILLMRLVGQYGGRKKELSQLRGEFDDYRGKVKEHFETTSELFQDMTEKYRDVYNHLAAGANDFGTGDDAPARLEIVQPKARLGATAAAGAADMAEDSAAEIAPDAGPTATDEAPKAGKPSGEIAAEATAAEPPVDDAKPISDTASATGDVAAPAKKTSNA
jgi:hypothetical protein